MGINLKVKNFRCLRDVDWSPDGVCLLVGPNGAGKTTLFDSLRLLRLAYELDPEQAVIACGGSYLRHKLASPEDQVSITLDSGQWSWQFLVLYGEGPTESQILERMRDDSGHIYGKKSSDNSTSIHNLSYSGSTILKALTGVR